MLPRGISTKTLNTLVEELRHRGIWAERHSYSLRLMYNNLIVGSLHLYPGYNEASLRLYGDNDVNKYVEFTIRDVISRYLPDFRVRVQVIRVSLK